MRGRLGARDKRPRLPPIFFVRNFSHCSPIKHLEEPTRRGKKTEPHASDSIGQIQSLAGVERAGSHGSCIQHLRLY